MIFHGLQWVFVMTHKNDVADCFEQFIDEMRRMHGKEVKISATIDPVRECLVTPESTATGSEREATARVAPMVSGNVQQASEVQIAREPTPEPRPSTSGQFRPYVPDVPPMPEIPTSEV